VAKTESGAQFREALQELLFVLLPLVVLAVVMLGSDRSIEELSRSEEWSFAAAVLMGQAAVWAGADETRPSRALVAAQIVLFVLSVGVFIVAARAGRAAVPVIDGVEPVSGHPRVRIKGFVQPPRKGVDIWFLRQHGSGSEPKRQAVFFVLSKCV
jgi:Mn2+/Fe2+ NRAMP family transporter